jgi:hypothetical protein
MGQPSEQRSTSSFWAIDAGTIRPTSAESLGHGRYRLLPTDDYDPEDEEWQILPGTVVICELRDLSAGTYLVAVRPA